MTTAENPTRTLTIEKAWQREINRRWARFTKIAVDALVSANNAAILTNVTKPFEMDPSQIRAYMAFLNTQIEQILLDVELGGEINWQARYQLASYERSLDVSRASLRRQGASLTPTTSELIRAQGITPFTATPSLATAIGGNFPPIHADSLQFLFERSFDSLKGWTDKMAVETRQILMDSVSEGRGITETVKLMRKRIDVSKSRAELIARTETIQAYQISSTNEAKRASEELDEEVLLRWLTSRDGRVRHLHREWHGTMATPEENSRRINKSPWNCRCAQAPVIAEANTDAENDKFTQQRKQLLSLESAKSRRKGAKAKRKAG